MESINVTFDEDCVTKDYNEIFPSRKSEGSVGESMKDEEEAPEQGQENKETVVNQEEIRNDQQDVQENSPKALKNGVKRIIRQIKSSATQMKELEPEEVNIFVHQSKPTFIF